MNKRILVCTALQFPLNMWNGKYSNENMSEKIKWKIFFFFASFRFIGNERWTPWIIIFHKILRIVVWLVLLNAVAILKLETKMILSLIMKYLHSIHTDRRWKTQPRTIIFSVFPQIKIHTPYNSRYFIRYLFKVLIKFKFNLDDYAIALYFVYVF